MEIIAVKHNRNNSKNGRVVMVSALLTLLALSAAGCARNRGIEILPLGNRSVLTLNSDDVVQVMRAAGFSDEQIYEHGTALYDGLLKAFDDEDVDTIVLLSDGEPTEGALIEAVDILEDITLRNELRRIVIHCVSVNHVSTVLEGLAQASGGTFLRLNQLDTIPDKLEELTENTLVGRSETELWDRPWVFLLFFGMIVLEWIGRKVARLL